MGERDTGDIIAYTDPLGAKTPRIKVQVKHKPETATGAADVRALLGILKAGDMKRISFLGNNE